ncbi:MAG: DUF2608 domain-containing protein [Rickettsiaceae bacterium]|nr:MAG: DUF2608 domain-containing protein [Rickettsiaceae bacterium]
MIKFLIKVSITIILMSHVVYGQIIETNSLIEFEQTAATADKDSLVIFDVQEVLMVANDQILTPLYKADRKVLKDKIITNYSPKQQEELFSILLKEYQTNIVDNALLKTLKELKHKEIKTIALTSGYTGKYGVIKSREDLRIERLKKIGVDFSYSFPSHTSKITLQLKSTDKIRIPMYKAGIVFASRFSKGEVLAAFLEKIKYKPKKIIFVDNQLKNIQSVEKYCDEQGILFTGFFYNFIRSKPKLPLNQEIAKYQFKILEQERRWVSDQQAHLELMAHHKK